MSCCGEQAQPDDAELVARCRQGDAQAWATLVHRYERVVNAIARRVGLDHATAADVFQTVFMRLFQHLNNLSEPGRLRAWVITTTRREASRQRTLAARTELITATADDAEPQPPEPPEPTPDWQNPQDSLEHWQELVAIQQAFDRLNPRCQQLLKALFLEDDGDYGSIARKLSMPVGSIGPTRGRCLKRLRQMLE